MKDGEPMFAAYRTNVGSAVELPSYDPSVALSVGPRLTLNNRKKQGATGYSHSESCSDCVAVTIC